MSDKIKKPHKHAEMIKQWAEDTSLTVQLKNIYDYRWVDTQMPNWHEKYEYRFKPKETTNKPHKYAEMIKQWVEDRSLIVQYYDKPTYKWIDTKYPSWYEDYEYRFKPKEPEETITSKNMITPEEQKRREEKMVLAWSLRGQGQITEEYSKLIYEEAGLNGYKMKPKIKSSLGNSKLINILKESDLYLHLVELLQRVANTAAERAIEELPVKNTSISFRDLNRIYALDGVKGVANKAIEFYVVELKNGKHVD